MLRQPRTATAARFSDDNVAQRVPGRFHPLNGQDIPVKRIRQFQKTLDIFI
jgi:hypothetical protein